MRQVVIIQIAPRKDGIDECSAGDAPLSLELPDIRTSAPLLVERSRQNT